MLLPRGGVFACAVGDNRVLHDRRDAQGPPLRLVGDRPREQRVHCRVEERDPAIELGVVQGRPPGERAMDAASARRATGPCVINARHAKRDRSPSGRAR